MIEHYIKSKQVDCLRSGTSSVNYLRLRGQSLTTVCVVWLTSDPTVNDAFVTNFPYDKQTFDNHWFTDHEVIDRAEWLEALKQVYL